MLSCIVSSVFIDLCFFQFVVNISSSFFFIVINYFLFLFFFFYMNCQCSPIIYSELFAPRYIMPMIVFICQHCHEQQFRNTVMCCCVLICDFLSSKVKCMHTSTVTRSHSCSEKYYAYASRGFCFYLQLHHMT